MSVSINEVQSKLLKSGYLDTAGSPQTSSSLPYDSIIEEVVSLWADKSLIPTLKESITRKKLIASSDLLQSISPKVETRGNNIVRFTLMMAKHWAAADTGRKAGRRPPIKAIEQWITAKGIQVRQSKTEKTLSVLQRRRKMAFAIARSIGAKGTIKRFNYGGSNYFTEVVPGEFKLLSDLVTRAVGYSVIIDISLSFSDPAKKK